MQRCYRRVISAISRELSVSDGQFLLFFLFLHTSTPGAWSRLPFTYRTFGVSGAQPRSQRSQHADHPQPQHLLCGRFSNCCRRWTTATSSLLLLLLLLSPLFFFLPPFLSNLRSGFSPPSLSEWKQLSVGCGTGGAAWRSSSSPTLTRVSP